MVTNLRPDLRIDQQFVTPAPVVLGAVLPPNLYGINRQLEWRGNAGAFVGGQANDPYNFPNLIAGSKVEQETAVEEILRPHVFISNRFGIAEVAPTYNWGDDPPTFDLSPTLSAIFEIASGSTGDYASSSGKFIDPNADFIEDEVSAGDVILIDGYPALDVTDLISDDELDVTKIDKGAQTYSGDLGIADGNGDRVFEDAGYDFLAAGVAVEDLVEINFWDIISRADGVDYTEETVGVRTISSDVNYDFAGAGVQPPIIGPPYQVDIVWIKDTEGDWAPTFKVTANIVAQSFDAINLITLPAWPGPTDSEENKIFEIFHYTQMDLDPLGTPSISWTDNTGAYTADGTPAPGQRNFTAITAFIDFQTMNAGGPLLPARHRIVVHGINDAGGTTNARPIFKIVSITNPTTLVVENMDPDRPQDTSFASGVTWEVWDEGTAAVVSFLGSDVTAEGGGGAPVGERTLTSTYNDFSAATGEDVAVGDAVFSDTGVALFLVTGDTLTTGSDNELYVANIIPGNPASGWSDAEFGFYIGADNPVNLKVTQVVDATTLTIRNILSDPPAADFFIDLYYTIEVPDVINDADYTIEKTVTGALLTGDVLSTYTARRTDHIDEPIEVTDETLEELVGPAVPANPLGLGCSIALENSNYSVYATQVEDDTDAKWDDAIAKGRNEKYYILCPLTQDESVLSAFRTHVALESDPDTKREKILFQNHLFNRIDDRTEDEAGDNAQVTKTASTTTITVQRDLSAYGVIVGDIFTGLTPAFAGRIITLVSGTTSTLTIVNDNGLPVAGPTPITDWEITSKDLTDLQYAQKIAAYPGTIDDRRIRNVYPDQCEVTFTDETDASGISGFYGGGDITETVPGYYVTAMETGKRGSQRPGQALTQFPGTGITRLLNPFGDVYGNGDVTLNDIVLDGGNYLMSQPITDGECSAVRAITTDVSDVFKLEEQVTVQVDNYARALRRQIRPLLGRYNIAGPFFDLVSSNIQAVIDDIKDDQDAKEIIFRDLTEVENKPDTFAVKSFFEAFVSGAKGEITVFI